MRKNPQVGTHLLCLLPYLSPYLSNTKTADFATLRAKKNATETHDFHNRALEAAGRPERIDHRSYKRQGVEKIPSIHMGPAASQMERRGIATEKSEINRQITADNKLLKEIKARITRIYNWSKEQAAQPQGKESVIAQLWQARMNAATPRVL